MAVKINVSAVIDGFVGEKYSSFGPCVIKFISCEGFLKGIYG